MNFIHWIEHSMLYMRQVPVPLDPETGTSPLGSWRMISFLIIGSENKKMQMLLSLTYFSYLCSGTIYI